MPYKHWFVSRQKRQLTTILPALIAFSDVCVGERWAGNTDLQLLFEDELQKRDITEHGNLRARRSGAGGGGTRTLFKQMKDLGLVFTEDINGLCRLTLIAESLIKGEISFVDAMKIQLQKYQYPSAACWTGTGSVDHSFRVHPFQFLLRLLLDRRLEGKLSADEIAYIVIHHADSDSTVVFENVISLILKNRKDDNPLMRAKEADKTKTFYNIANTFCNYLSLTQFLDRGFKTISIRHGKYDEVESFIQSDPKFIPHPELSENYIRAYGRGNSAKDLRDFTRNDIKSQKELTEARIRKEYVLLALRTPVTGITDDIVQAVTQATGLDEKLVEKFLIQNYPHGNINDFFAAYKELAHMGTSGAREFETATCEMFRKIFKMRAEHVGPIGNTPDVFIESKTAGYCAIIDNKAYKDRYSITGDHKRVMEDVYIPDYKTYGKTKEPLAFFTYIAGSFGSNIDTQLKEIHTDTGVDCSAMPVDILISIAQDYAESGLNHEALRRIFSVNREVRLSDVDEEKSQKNYAVSLAAEHDERSDLYRTGR